VRHLLDNLLNSRNRLMRNRLMSSRARFYDLASIVQGSLDASSPWPNHLNVRTRSHLPQTKLDNSAIQARSNAPRRIEMPPLRRVARRTARRTARRQDSAAAPPEAAPDAPAAAAPAAPAAAEEPAYMAELQQLNQLKEEGILSEEEYAAKKQQILGL
jgi:putative oligomerization/nucleic acid binding protein